MAALPTPPRPPCLPARPPVPPVHAGLHGGTDVQSHHGGSPLRLLLLLLVCNSALWTLIYSLHSRLLVRFSCVGLPALAVLPLWASSRFCQRTLQSPGIHPPLADLYRLLSLAQ